MLFGADEKAHRMHLRAEQLRDLVATISVDHVVRRRLTIRLDAISRDALMLCNELDPFSPKGVVASIYPDILRLAEIRDDATPALARLLTEKLGLGTAPLASRVRQG